MQTWPAPFRAPGTGLLGSRPPFQQQQAMMAYQALTPTPLGKSTGTWDSSSPYTALSNTGVRTHPPSATKWYLDIGATTHMASFPGNFPTILFKPSSSVIIVGNGARLHVSHQTFSSILTSSSLLYLCNVLVAPSLIKNLVPVRWLNRDNNVSIEFDPSGFSIKDLPTRVEML